MDKPQPLIEMQNLVKQYQMGSQILKALNNVSINVYTGDMLAIVGASGSGKTTLMNIIGLLDNADLGEYLLCGKNVALLTENELANLRNQRIGFVFQQFNLLPRLTALQNVMLPLHCRKISSKDMLNQATLALNEVGVGGFLTHRPSELSGGQQQRVAIARALVGTPDVILADEPTGALDSKTGLEIMSLFRALNAIGRTIIIVTHDERVAAMCQRKITLADGRIV